MSGVYGDMLAYFPELFEIFEHFTMKALTVAGYAQRVILAPVQGVLQYVKRGNLTEDNSVMNEVDIPTLWSRDKLSVGEFISAKDKIYRIIRNNDWENSGTFFVYELETVNSITDTQTKGSVDISGGFK